MKALIYSILGRLGLLPPPAQPFDPNPLRQPVIPLTEEGWIACQHALPEYDRAVQILLGGKFEAVGVRTRIVNPAARSEQWTVSRIRQPEKVLLGIITHWRPL